VSATTARAGSPRRTTVAARLGRGNAVVVTGGAIVAGGGADVGAADVGGAVTVVGTDEDVVVTGLGPT
jgi:hypothetical protein